MKRENRQKPASAALERLQRRLELWRKGRTSARARLPEGLWGEAVAAARRHGVWRVAQVLRLDYATLRRRLSLSSAGQAVVRDGGAAFVEFARTSTAVDIGVEIEQPGGKRVRIHFPAQSAAELIELSERLWRAGQ